MKEAAKNGLRSGLVVIGAVAFGYLSLQLGFKPYLENAQQYNNPDTKTETGNDNNLHPQSDQQQHQQDQVTVVLDDGFSPQD